MNGEKNLLFEQYKVYVEMMDRTSGRRAETNKFYITLLSGLLAFLTFLLGRQFCTGYEDIVIGLFAVLGLILCWVWHSNIRSYRELNSGKFKIIHEMEKDLPYECFNREWDILKASKYKRLTQVEQTVPKIMAIPYILLLFYTVSRVVWVLFAKLPCPSK
jgi:hypothetical protein